LVLKVCLKTVAKNCDIVYNKSMIKWLKARVGWTISVLLILAFFAGIGVGLYFLIAWLVTL
jgi:hypothetical protein